MSSESKESSQIAGTGVSVAGVRNMFNIDPEQAKVIEQETGCFPVLNTKTGIPEYPFVSIAGLLKSFRLHLEKTYQPQKPADESWKNLD